MLLTGLGSIQLCCCFIQLTKARFNTGNIKKHSIWSRLGLRVGLLLLLLIQSF